MKLKKFFNEKPLGKIIRSVGLGVVDSVLPVKGIAGGVINGVKEAVDKNINDKVTEEGAIDWVRIAVFLSLFGLIVFLLWQLFSGSMSLDEVINYFKQLGLLNEI